jgi:hypothetical protein
VTAVLSTSAAELFNLCATANRRFGIRRISFARPLAGRAGRAFSRCRVLVSDALADAGRPKNERKKERERERGGGEGRRARPAIETKLFARALKRPVVCAIDVVSDNRDLRIADNSAAARIFIGRARLERERTYRM